MRRQRFIWAIRACIVAGVSLITSALWRWGAVEVRGHLEEVFFLTFSGAVWLLLSIQLFPWLGLSVVDDVGERRNPAALAGLCGAILSVAITYAAGNLGEGPSYRNNLFSAALATAGLFVISFALELSGPVSVSIAEERDLASGVRLCGFLLAVGLILGRAVAGDWHSVSATVKDYLRDSWPAALLYLVAAVVEWFVRPSRARPFPAWPRFGLLPALAYLALAAVWVRHLGRWEGMPR